MTVGCSLTACVSELQDAVDSIRRATDRLRLSSTSLVRTSKLVKLRKKHDLVTPDGLFRARQSISASLEPRFDDILLRAEDILTGIEDEASAAAAKVHAASLQKPIKNGRGDKVVAAMSSELTSARTRAKELKRSLARATADKRRLESELERTRAGAETRSHELRRRKEQMRLDRAAADAELRRRKIELQEQLDRTVTESKWKRMEAGAVRSDTKLRLMKAAQRENSAQGAERRLTALLAAYECQLRFFMSPRFQEKGQRSFLPFSPLSVQLQLLIQCLADTGSTAHNRNVLTRYVDDLKARVMKCQDSLFADAKSLDADCSRRLKSTVRALFPDGAAGATMAMVLDALLSANNGQVSFAEFEKVFPPEQERRHCLAGCLRTLASLHLLQPVDQRSTIQLRPA